MKRSLLARLFGVKSSNQVRTSRDLLDVLTGGLSSDAGENVNLRTASHHGAVFQCVRVLSESIGSLPIGFYRSIAGAGRERVDGHNLYRLLGVSPNETQTAAEFWEMCMVHLGYRGNFYAYINRVKTGRNAGMVGELIPFHPDAVAVNLKSDGVIEYQVYFNDGRSEVLPPRDVLHIKILSLDGIVGMNPIEHARNTIGLSMALERHGARMFKNGARPGGVLSTESRLDELQAKAYREMWEAAHSGDRSGGTAVLGNGLKYQAIAMSAVDSQWLENRKFQRSDIAAFYRVPPHKINEMESATFGNIEHQSLEFVRDTLIPYATKIEQRIKVSLLTDQERQAGYFAKFNFNGLLRGDTASRSAFYQSSIYSGIMSPNEARALEDMNPREGGDSFLTPLNMAIDGKPPEATPTA